MGNPAVTAEASIHIDAHPDRVYALVSDITRMGEWSPECYRAEWLDGASGPAIGAKFVGHNRTEKREWSTTCTVVAADPGREFAFEVHGVEGRAEPTSRWSYRLTASPGGTDVTESMEGYRRLSAPARALQRAVTVIKDRAAHNAAGMAQTLERLKAVAESAP
jgi:uncharacterized protein YndB with AHSA1/START domain